MKYILDACALLAVSNKERGADAVQELLSQAEAGEAGIYISVINLLEVYYKLMQQKGPEPASVFIKSILYASPIKIVGTIPFDVFNEAAPFQDGVQGIACRCHRACNRLLYGRSFRYRRPSRVGRYRPGCQTAIPLDTLTLSFLCPSYFINATPRHCEPPGGEAIQPKDGLAGHPRDWIASARSASQ
jgi:PIN domain nuclease of toxin-antitoxin system